MRGLAVVNNTLLQSTIAEGWVHQTLASVQAKKITGARNHILAELKKTGYDGVEIPVFEGDAAHYKGLRKELDDKGLRCTTVTVATPEASSMPAVAPMLAMLPASPRRLLGAVSTR